MRSLIPSVNNDNPKLVILENIHVAAPCPADWTRMFGDDRVRHCCQCNLNVYNISEMTRSEAEDLIRSCEGRLCVRFYRRADGTILTQNCPLGLRVLIRRVSRVAAAVLSAAMSVAPTLSLAASKKPAPAQENQATAGIDVTVVDPTGAVIQNAKAVLCRCKDHVSVNVNTDARGVAHFAGLTDGAYLLEIEAFGFKTTKQNVRIKASKVETLQVKLQVAPVAVTVDVKGGPTVVMGATLGLVSSMEVPFPGPSGPGGRPGQLK